MEIGSGKHAGAEGSPGHEPAASTDWMSLLLNEAPSPDLVSHKDRLVRAGGVPAAVAERQFEDALTIRERLDQRRRRADELTALNAIAGQLASVTDIDLLLTQIVEHAKDLLRVDLAYLSLIHAEQVTIVVAAGQISSYLTKLTMPIKEGFSSAVVANAAPLWTSDYRRDERFQHHERADAAARLEDIRGLLGVPMLSQGKIVGVLFAAKRQERQFATDEIELLTALAAHAAVALVNSRVLAEQKTSAEQLQAANARLESTIRWNNALTALVLRGGDVSDLLSEVSREAGYPAIFVRSASDLPDELRNDTEVSNRILAVNLDSDSYAEIVTEARSILAVPVVASGDWLGVLFLDRPRDATVTAVDQLMVLERAALSVALLLLGQHVASEAARKTRDGLLLDLLTRQVDDHREINTQVRLAGLNPALTYSVAVILPVGDRAAVRRSLEALVLQSHSAICDYGQRFVLVVPRVDPEELAVTLSTSTIAAAATTGIAGQTKDVSELTKYFNEASQTVDVMLTLGAHGQTATAERLGLYRILLSHAGTREVSRLFEIYLGPVKTEEDRSGVPLLETLDCFLRNNQRHAVTAGELNIHSNTLYQRLEKLTKVLGTRWKHPDHALDLQLVLRLEKSAKKLGARTK
ncbi:PucR-like helix-turn-helix protein [Williamsia limnetica]|uniref:PucR-like helix-turn-helix protein n=1 Tax=Williamsia limnetica TaxID=882452 RepID=A0A318RE63_WILLI|nr:PucR-like helix-turn-helix protein [Williamsia limnetica]